MAEAEPILEVTETHDIHSAEGGPGPSCNNCDAVEVVQSTTLESVTDTHNAEAEPVIPTLEVTKMLDIHSAEGGPSPSCNNCEQLSYQLQCICLEQQINLSNSMHSLQILGSELEDTNVKSCTIRWK